MSSEQLVDSVVCEVFLFKEGVIIINRVREREASHNRSVSYGKLRLIVVLLEASVVENSLGARIIYFDIMLAEVIDYRLNIVELRKIVKFKLQVVYIKLLRLCVCENERRVDLDALAFVSVKVDGSVVENLDLNGEEKEGSFNRGFL